ncbi:site-specific integrase [Desulforhabdus sp. TSK]|uniref:site-specific integrase n=1 Tax=Desulforhabdus sp. TSK TaxID=2925014 RepID=UPI001FC8E212|nr:site-specific integrase [Desulforhabdus sp. TSK]GKT10963.1 integrase [Desulforhabdus sp. TSK]
MFEEFFDGASRVQGLRDSSGGPFLEKFAEELFHAGYAEITARRHIRAAEHFIYWSGSEGIPISSLTEKLVERFDDHLNGCQCPRYGRTHRLELLNGVRLFLKCLRGAGAIATVVGQTTVPDPVLFTAFCEWMRKNRGTCDATLYNYSLSIRDLLKQLGEDPRLFDAGSLRQFVLEKSQQCGWAAAKTCTTALRMFLRFLIAEGKCSADLHAAIPVLAHWRLSSLPRYLQQEEVERIVSSCDLNSAVGKRDRAILLLLARMGLRAGDIVQLRLGDIDWEGATVEVTGKGRREVRLPLTQEIGCALVAYLQDGRPRTDTDVLFVRSRAPFRAFASHSAVSVIVEKAMQRADVTCQSRGAAHVLRHSAATSMLRQGASLQDIADILRHASIETTQIYAKVDVTALSLIAQPWPEVQP